MTVKELYEKAGVKSVLRVRSNAFSMALAEIKAILEEVEEDG